MDTFAVEVKGFECNAGGAYYNQCALTLQDLVVTICNSTICVKNLCLFPVTLCLCASYDSRNKPTFFPFAKNHSLIGLSDGNTLFPVRYKLNMYVLMHSNFSLLSFRTLMKYLGLSSCVILLWISIKVDWCQQSQILSPWLSTCPC